MDIDHLLEQLLIEDERLVFTFFVVYSRFEYSLKKLGYVQERENGLEIQAECFIAEIRDEFDPERTDELEDAVSYLLDRPTDIQTLNENGNLDFEEHPSTEEGHPVALRVYHSIRIARNNLFHGGKFKDGEVQDPGRDEDLLRSSLAVLKEFIRLNSRLQNTFWPQE